MATVEEQAIELRLVPAHDAAVVAALLKSASFPHARSSQPEHLRWLCSHPDTPLELLFTLVQFPELRTELAHRDGPHELLEVLAEAYGIDEAILTLGKRYYADATFSSAEFAAFLQQHVGHRWLLESLCHAALSSPEKADKLREHLQSESESARWLEMLDRRAVCDRARTLTDANELERLFALQQPDVYLALALNPATPRHVLLQLAAMQGVAQAAKIRRAAQDNLDRRK